MNPEIIKRIKQSITLVPQITTKTIYRNNKQNQLK